MTPELWQAATSTGALADLTPGVRLRLAGPDAIRYLNGQVTQDVRRLTPALTLPGCVTNHKGKLEAYVHLTAGPPGSLLISGPANLRDFLPLRLEKYLIADDCALEDLTETTTLLHFTGPATALLPDLNPHEQTTAASRFGPAGTDLWTTPDRLDIWQDKFPVLTPKDLAVLEVIHCIPAWDHELTPGLLPPEAGLDATAIDYHKGCYIGQEVISRIRSVGRVNRLLASLIQTGGPPVESGFTIQSPTGPAGEITRAAFHPLTGQRHALAFLRRGTSGFLTAGPENDPAPSLLHIQKTLDD